MDVVELIKNPYVIAALVVVILVLIFLLKPKSNFKNYTDAGTPAQPNNPRYYMFGKK